MKKGFFLLAFCISSMLAFAQVPSTCFEIESILVDACADGNNCGFNNAPACECEGKNEMLRFVVGPDDLDTDDMYIEWPNGANAFLGVCQSASTASIVSELNATIQNCGWLVEPVNNVLPAGKKVLMVTSADMCTTSNSFAGLADTLVIIFQCSGNYFGHFANYNNSSNNLRTLEIDFGPGCSDEVTYDRSDLVDEVGINTPADGASVDFTWPGDPSYYNNGCTAPIEQAFFEAGDNQNLCPGDVINLSANVSDSYTNIQWSGGDGVFGNPTDVNTTYTPSANEADEVIITLSAEGCGGIITDELTLYNFSNALTGISSSNGNTICTGGSTTLIAEGFGVFNWSTSVTAPSIEVSTAGIYSVSLTNACGTETVSYEVFEEDLPVVDITNPVSEEICEGSDLIISATSSGGDLTWSVPGAGTQITVNNPGWYYATVSNDCAVVMDSVEYVEVPLPSATISPEGPIEICEDETIELSVSGEGNFDWNTTETTTMITVSQIGTYTVTASNLCGTDTDEVELIFGGYLPVASITASDLLICPGETSELIATGGDSYVWNELTPGANFTASSDGVYTVEVSNDCGTDSESVQINLDEVAIANLEDGPNFAICNGEEAQVSVSGNGQFTWSDGAVANAQSFDATGAYYVVAEANCGTDTAFFNVLESGINAQLYASPIAGGAPLVVDFTNETYNAEEVYWVFEPGMVGYGQEQSHTFLEEGDYTVIMEVSSELGCQDAAQVLISVGECPFALFIPTAFTPNADGHNDVMEARGECIDSFEWHIYDRWGREVYYSEDFSELWNGADQSGYAVLNGLYSYWIKVIDANAEVHKISGTITVIR